MTGVESHASVWRRDAGAALPRTRIRRSNLALGMGIGFLGFGGLILVLGILPAFFAAWFAAAGIIGLLLGRCTRVAVHPSAGADSVALVVVRPVRVDLRRGGLIRFHQVVLFESLQGDGGIPELHRMAARVDAGIARGCVFESAAAQAEFEDRLTLLGLEYRRGGRVVAVRFTHAGSRRVGAMLAWRMGCPLLDCVDTRARMQGPESLRVPYFERAAAWREPAVRGPVPAGLVVEETAGVLSVVFPGAIWFRIVPILVAATGVVFLRYGFHVAGIVATALGGVLFLISLAVGIGARLQVDRESLRFRWRLPWCRTRIIALENVDTIRVFENALAILATTGSVEIVTGCAQWLRRRIEAFVLDA